MNYFDYYIRALKNYAGFTGRATRPEFWWFMLFSFLISLGFSILDSILGLGDPDTGFSPLNSLYGLAVLVPTLAVGARRLHDTGKSGWWQLLWLIPFFGWIALIVLFILEGTSGSNEYGPDLKSEGGAVVNAED